MSASVDAACAGAVGGDGRRCAASRSDSHAGRSGCAAQAMWTGPVMERRSAGLIDWPVDAEGVTALVEGADAAELTPELIAGSVGADVRGLRSLDGVLGRDDAVELLGDPRWCAYAHQRRHDDRRRGERHRRRHGRPVSTASRRSPTSSPTRDEAQDWLSMFVDDNIQLVRLRRTADRRRGRRAVHRPVRGPRAPAHRRRGRVRRHRRRCSTTTSTPRPRPAARSTPSEALRAGDARGRRRALDELDKTLSTDVAGQLDVTIGFSDADGDGSG